MTFGGAGFVPTIRQVPELFHFLFPVRGHQSFPQRNLPHIARMPLRVPPRLRPDREAVWLDDDADLGHGAVRRVDHVGVAVEAAGQP